MNLPMRMENLLHIMSRIGLSYLTFQKGDFMKKFSYIFGGLCIFICSVFLSSCDNADFMSEKALEELSKQEREEVNAMMDTMIASDGDTIYNMAGELVYRLDLEKKEFQVNCGDLLCDHESTSCGARLPFQEQFYQLRRNGNRVFVLGNKVYEVSKNAKKEIGHDGYGLYGSILLFGDYIAYFEKEDTVVVKHLEKNQEIQRFEDIRPYVQGSFYYDGHLYYITDTTQLVRLNLKTGAREVLEKKGATRASVYDGFIYYIKVSNETDTNFLIKMNPDSLEMQEIIEGVFYYNMLGDKLYYSTYPDRQLYCSDLDGVNPVELSRKGEYTAGWIWTFPETGTVLLDTEDSSIYYLLDVDSGEIISETPVVLPLEDEFYEF